MTDGRSRPIKIWIEGHLFIEGPPIGRRVRDWIRIHDMPRGS